jgi:hypothetical protein
MGSLIALVVVGLLLPGIAIAQQQPTSVPTVDLSVEVFGKTLADFSTRMDSYAELRRALEEGLPPLKVTGNPSEIYQAELLLAQRIRQARRGTGRGDIFTENIRKGFRQLLRPVTNAGTCSSIKDDNPGEFAYAVNSAYPKDRPFSTVPPSLLEVLPRLPADVWYRFLGRDLILHDSRANVILDRIDDAIRCP